MRFVRAALLAAMPLILVPGPSPARTVVLRPLAAPARAFEPGAALPAFHKVGLGKTLTTSDRGQVFGFDINQHGSDGVLASAQTIDSQGDALVSMETFDQDTGQITKTFAVYKGKQNEYAVDGVFLGDVALVTHFVTPKGSIFATRSYETMNPVTAEKFTGTWTPSIKDIDVTQSAENQTTKTAVLFAIELKNQDNPLLVVSDVAANAFSNVIALDPNLFGGGNGPQLGQFTAAGKAVIALSPDGGAVGGKAPINVLIDLKTGKETQFTGLNEGPFGSGFVNGLAVDPNTGIAATTTELNAQVEFYDLAKQAGIGIQLPCTNSSAQTLSGSGIAVDPLHKLFLVTEQAYGCNPNTSAIIVYDESGRALETITGFKFALGEPAPVLNPSKRMGWAFGPHFNQLRQFFY